MLVQKYYQDMKVCLDIMQNFLAYTCYANTLEQAYYYVEDKLMPIILRRSYKQEYEEYEDFNWKIEVGKDRGKTKRKIFQKYTGIVVTKYKNEDTKKFDQLGKFLRGVSINHKFGLHVGFFQSNKENLIIRITIMGLLPKDEY